MITLGKIIRGLMVVEEVIVGEELLILGMLVGLVVEVVVEIEILLPLR